MADVYAYMRNLNVLWLTVIKFNTIYIFVKYISWTNWLKCHGKLLDDLQNTTGSRFCKQESYFLREKWLSNNLTKNHVHKKNQQLKKISNLIFCSYGIRGFDYLTRRMFYYEKLKCCYRDYYWAAIENSSVTLPFSRKRAKTRKDRFRYKPLNRSPFLHEFSVSYLSYL